MWIILKNFKLIKRRINDNNGYILFLALMLISLIGLFVPLLIQQNQINYKITADRAVLSQHRTAAEAGIEYLLYKLENNAELPISEEIVLADQINIRLSGEEADSCYKLISSAGEESRKFIVELSVGKEELNQFNKIIRRGD
ncbi:MAG: hypothetical protein ACOCQE_03300 [Halanaerobium sp.]